MDHCHFRNDKRERRMDDLAHERPSKQRRLSSADGQRDNSQEEDISGQMQSLVQQLSLMPLSSYFTTSTIDAVVQRFTCLLVQTSTVDDHRLMAQIHGLLLQWLDYTITSQKMRDITAEDDTEVKNKVVATVAHICACLKEVYRCSQWNLQTYEALYILVRAMLTIVDPHDKHRFEETTGLLQLLEIAVQHGHPYRLPICLQQQFVLCLAEACDLETTVEKSSSNFVPQLEEQCGAFGAAARNILLNLSTLGQSRKPDISVYATTALSTLMEASPSMSLTPTLSQLFQLQCVLRMSRYQPRQEAVYIVPFLSRTVMTSHTGQPDDLSRYQALDCVLTLAFRRNESNVVAELSSSLMEILVRVLSNSSATPFDLALKVKATEGLQLLLESDVAHQNCLAFLTKGDKDINLKPFVSSLVEISNIGRSHRWSDNDKRDDMSHVINFTNNSVVVAASEILLSVICMSLEGSGQSMLISPSYLVAICIALLQQHSNCEHVVYLTVRVICRDNRNAFFGIVQMYPELLSALANVICDADSAPTTKQAILFFLQEILQVRPSLTTVIARQPGVVEAVTSVASFSHVLSESNITPEMHQMAVNLLFTLSSDVCNRRILARQARVLASMIQFVREHTATSYDGDASQHSLDEISSLPTGCHREAMKQRIMQLAAVL
jgi:hypothetical protein